MLTDKPPVGENKSTSSRVERVWQVQPAAPADFLQDLASAGFSPLAEEWWHWSFGDQRWAVFRGADHARYGLVSP